MASRFWVGGTTTWNGTAGTKWATTSGGAGGATVPTTADDVFFDASSGVSTVTLAAGDVARSINCTGFTGTISHPASFDFQIGDATAGAGNIALKLVSGMTYTLGSATTSTIAFISTSATQQSVDFGGKTMAAINFNGVGGSWQLVSALTTSQSVNANTVTLTAGSLDTNGQSITTSRMLITGTTTRSLTLGASVINLIANGANVWDASTITNLTFNAGTSAITAGSANTSFGGLGLTYYDVTLSHNSGGSITLNGNNTFHNFSSINASTNTRLSVTGDQTVNGALSFTGLASNSLGLIYSGTRGTQRTFTVASISTIDNINLQDIIIAGAASPYNASANNVGDMGNNSGITFPTGQTMYLVTTGPATSWNAVASWKTTSGGVTTASRLPLPQDTAVIDANSFSATGRTLNVNAQCYPTLDYTGATNTPTLNHSVINGILFIKGSFKLAAGLTITGTSPITFHGRSAGDQILTNGCTVTNTINVESPGGTVTLADNLTTSNSLQLNYGTLDLNDKTVSVANFTSNFTTTRTLTMRSSNLTLSGTAVVWTTNPNTNMTINPGTSTVFVTDTSATSKTFSMGGVTINNLTISGGGTGVIQTAAGSVNAFTVTGPKTVQWTPATAMTVNTFNAKGTLGNLVTLKSSTGGIAFTLSSASGIINCDYLSLQDCTATGGATWFAGPNSTNVSNNSGWIFTAANYALTKSLAYSIRTTHTAVTKSMQYDVRKAQNITKALKYTINSPLAITKSLSYKVRTSPLAITKALKYTVRTSPTAITKSARYTVRRPAAITKALKYNVKRATGITKAATYTIRKNYALTKAATYLVRSQHKISLSAAYSVKTPHPLHQSMKYSVQVSSAPTIPTPLYTRNTVDVIRQDRSEAVILRVAQ